MNVFKKVGYDATGFGVTKLDYICIVDKIASYKKQALINDIKLSLFLRKAYRKINNQDIDAIVKILTGIQEEGLTLDYIFRRDNLLLLKHILKNGKRSTLMFLKTFPNIAEYLLKINFL